MYSFYYIPFKVVFLNLCMQVIPETFAPLQMFQLYILTLTISVDFALTGCLSLFLAVHCSC
jgi:hypothetical protein